jgi:hypothetical protein
MTNQNASMVALLVAQAEGQGADMVTLRALIEEASEVGAERALAALGLRDEHARRDIGATPSRRHGRRSSPGRSGSCSRCWCWA